MHSGNISTGLKPLSTSGVIYVMNRAAELGFTYANPDWCNFGQGAPETGPLEADEDRITSIPVDNLSAGYAPVCGVTELRKAVAELYNELYRKDKESKYSMKNVCVSGGGRLGVARMCAALDTVNIGHFTPDYASYEQLIDSYRLLNPIEIALHEEQGFRIDPSELRTIVQDNSISALLISNPCNPTGQHIRGNELASWVDIAREEHVLSIYDEFYSHYIYGESENSHHMVSAARYVEDVNNDPVVICEGMTKNWRYPGMRVCWTIGPTYVIEALQSIASAMDGGANHPAQHACIPLLKPSFVIEKTKALRKTFEEKATYLASELKEIGIDVLYPPQGSFYCWANLDKLPERLRNCFSFFEEGLKEKVICVPGTFFDITPGGKAEEDRRYKNYVRLSFGPSLDKMKPGIEGFKRVVAKHS